MRIVLIALIAAFFVTACGSRDTDQKFLIESFKIKNKGISIRKYTNTLFLSGTVPARKVGWAEDSRLKAHLGCFDWVYSVTGDTSETESHMCIYYVYGPESGGGRIWWNGDKDFFLKDLMIEHGFKAD